MIFEHAFCVGNVIHTRTVLFIKSYVIGAAIIDRGRTELSEGTGKSVHVLDIELNGLEFRTITSFFNSVLSTNVINGDVNGNNYGLKFAII